MITHKQLLSWMQEIHEDTLEYGNEDQQFVLEQMIDYLKNNWKTVVVGLVVAIFIVCLCCCEGKVEEAPVQELSDEEIEKLF